MKRVALYTLGCKLNYTETATIGKEFIKNGYIVVGVDEPADVIVINSCSVTLHAERECRQLIRKALRYSPNAFVAVIGCYAQLQLEQIASIKGVDLVLGSKEKFSLIDYIDIGKKKAYPDVYVSCNDNHNAFEAASSVGFEERTRAFIKVQDGCDCSCSYCIVPLARGKSRSAKISEIMRQAAESVELDYKEIVLTGVNVGGYGIDSGTNLLTLLKQIVTIDGLKRIRVSSVEPNLLTDKLLDFWFEEGKLCNHWHIPLQSGSDTILSKMHRRYLTRLYRDRIERIKTYIPDAGIGADVIVGFPGETKDLFNETYEFIDKLPLSYLHVFSYSERPNTLAVEYEQKIDPKIKGERSKKLHQLSIKKRRAFYENFIGKTCHVLFESMNLDGTLSGLTEEYVRVDVNSQNDLTNKIVNVAIEKVLDEKCIGRIVESNIMPATRVAI